MITNEFLKDRVENLIIQCGTLTHLRFSSEFKLKSIKWNDKTPIGVFGLDKAGKTAILSYLTTGEVIEEYSPTFGLNRFTMPGVLGAEWEPVFLELSGREDFRPLWLEYEDLTGIIYVIDSDDRERIQESIQELEKLLKNPNFMRLPFSIIVNKQDLLTSKELSSIVSSINEISSSSYRISVFPASGITGEGLPASLHWLLEYIWWLAQNPEE